MLRRIAPALLFGLCACALPEPHSAPGSPRIESREMSHVFDGQTYAVTFLPDAAGMTFVTADGQVLSASEPPTARLAVSGGGLTRRDYLRALTIVADFCRGRPEFACRALRADNGGPIFVDGRWLFQFVVG